MKLQEFDISGLLLIVPTIHRDKRGFFLETYQHSRYLEALGREFIQDNLSWSRYGAIRGLHFQKEPYAQSKLIRCTWGCILDVAVDLRKGSVSFGSYVGIELNSQDQQQFFIPAGFAHGFSVLSNEAVVEYKCDAYYTPTAEAGLRYNDPTLNIDWRIPPNAMIISPKDSNLPLLNELKGFDQ